MNESSGAHLSGRGNTYWVIPDGYIPKAVPYAITVESNVPVIV